jgi:cytochrome c
VWTEQTVARLFEVGPDVMVPGSKMPLQRLPDARDRADLDTYLKRITMPESSE